MMFISQKKGVWGNKISHKYSGYPLHPPKAALFWRVLHLRANSALTRVMKKNHTSQNLQFPHDSRHILIPRPRINVQGCLGLVTLISCNNGSPMWQSWQQHHQDDWSLAENCDYALPACTGRVNNEKLLLPHAVPRKVWILTHHEDPCF